MRRKRANSQRSIVERGSDERRQARAIARALLKGRRPRAIRVQIETSDGQYLILPEALAETLANAAQAIADGADHVQVVAEERELTTSEAAELLGISRPHLIHLLEADGIPYRLVGTHRRIRLNDLLAYEASRQAQSSAAFQQLVNLSNEAGLYDLPGSEKSASE